MINHSTQSDDYLRQLVLRKKEKDTTIAGYCARSTECSDNSLKKTKKISQIGVVFFCML